MPKDGRYGIALIAAAAGGHERIVEMLLNEIADVNADGGYGAATRTTRIRIIVDILSDLKVITGNYRTALIAAAARGHQEIVEMLLNQYVDVNAESEHYGTALVAAAARGHEKIVEMLLNQNADVNSKPFFLVC